MRFAQSICPVVLTLSTLCAAGSCAAIASAQQPTNTASGDQLFPPEAVWNQDISHSPLDANSSAIVNWLATAGGWGTGRMQVDFALRVLQASANTPLVPFRPAQQFYMPDSDLVSQVPLPSGGGMEGQTGYQCPVDQQDCHLIVLDTQGHSLYEAYGANVASGTLRAVFMGLWDTSRVYPPSLRGDQCTSADAAGLPIAPLLFSADDLAKGHIDHAIRFILPNQRIRAGVFVRPATHTGNPSGPDLAPPMGTRLRLKASYDVSHLKPSAQIVARALQTYGMILADGGNITLTAQNDADTVTKYADVDFGSHDLDSLSVSDFEVIATSEPIQSTDQCVRNR